MAHIAPAVRDRIREGARQSGIALANLFDNKFNPDRVLDVGCGEGFLVEHFRNLGKEAHGIDGDKLPGVDRVVDLRNPPTDLGRFDLAVCLEVGEHLPHTAADTLVKFLVDSASTVAFSAAIPAQGGPGHINEQWPQYWVELFAKHGMKSASGALRWEIWDDPLIESWYRQNLLVFSGDVTQFDLVEDGCPSVVHPEIWQVYR